MRKLIYLLTLITFFSCKIIDPDELVPSYIYIEDIQVDTKLSEGSNSDKIIDAWVYVNGNNIGVFELPAKIPIHATGNYDLVIFPGIKNTSLLPERIKYPFYNSFDSTLLSVAHHIDTLKPTVTYKSTPTIWVEDFEDPGVKFTSISYSDTSLEITTIPTEIFEGNGAGKIKLAPHHLFFHAKTNEILFNSFPIGGNPVYMELNYKGNATLIVGIYHNNSSTTPVKEQYYRLKPSSSWNKTYLNLTTIVSPQTNADEFDVYLEVIQNDNSNAEIFVDNIKVIF